jgi:hypothetical protein
MEGMAENVLCATKFEAVVGLIRTSVVLHLCSDMGRVLNEHLKTLLHVA